MCIVQVNNSLVVSCAVNLVSGMIVYTNNRRVANARESILELLLINHPLDCPICDQGGECDLQDITYIFGSDRGRFYEPLKRAVNNINFCGPLIKTTMTRCIHCTRCVRFLDELTDSLYLLGTIGRGNTMEIGTYIESNLNNELSANIIDLCPVGALTSMPYAFSARSWESYSVESVDIMDAIGSAIRYDIISNKIVRIIPVIIENINEG
jgi:NADH dehydrogenase/NADH:ubiquinone oxidoreductase subunit G